MSEYLILKNRWNIRCQRDHQVDVIALQWVMIKKKIAKFQKHFQTLYIVRWGTSHVHISQFLNSSALPIRKIAVDDTPQQPKGFLIIHWLTRRTELISRFITKWVKRTLYVNARKFLHERSSYEHLHMLYCLSHLHEWRIFVFSLEFYRAKQPSIRLSCGYHALFTWYLLLKVSAGRRTM